MLSVQDNIKRNGLRGKINDTTLGSEPVERDTCINLYFIVGEVVSNTWLYEAELERICTR